MNLKGFAGSVWRGTKAHFVEFAVVVTALIMLAGLALIASAIVDVSRHVANIHAKAENAEREASEAKDVQAKLLKNSELNRKQWELLEQHNPEISVPQVVGDLPDLPEPTPQPSATPGIILSKKHPIPTATPRIEYRTKTKIKKVRAPTPKPFWDYFKKDPKRTR